MPKLISEMTIAELEKALRDRRRLAKEGNISPNGISLYRFISPNGASRPIKPPVTYSKPGNLVAGSWM